MTKRFLAGVAGAITVLTGLAFCGWPANRAVRADAPRASALIAHTIWQGTFEQSLPKSTYPMVLFIRQRQGSAFAGTSWYPTLENGLITVRGNVGPDGAVTFVEDKVLHGEGSAERPEGVVGGARYRATLEPAALKGTGEWTDPRTKQTATFQFSLKLAQ